MRARPFSLFLTFVLACLAILLGFHRQRFWDMQTTATAELAASERLNAVPSSPPMDGTVQQAKSSTESAANSTSQASITNIDRAMEKENLADICGYTQQHRSTSFEEIAKRSRSPERRTLESAYILDAYVSSHCSRSRAQPMRNSPPFDDTVRTLADNGDPEARRMLFASDVLGDEQASHQAQEHALMILEELMATTAHASMFEHAGVLLASHAATEPLLAADGSAMEPEQRLAAGTVGTLIARCRLFGDCAPNSILTLRACMPDMCTAQGMDGYLRQILNAKEMENSHRHADDLMARRQTH